MSPALHLAVSAVDPPDFAVFFWPHSQAPLLPSALWLSIPPPIFSRHFSMPLPFGEFAQSPRPAVPYPRGEQRFGPKLTPEFGAFGGPNGQSPPQIGAFGGYDRGNDRPTRKGPEPPIPLESTRNESGKSIANYQGTRLKIPLKLSSDKNIKKFFKYF
jgi:hypothetical protein